MGKTGRSFPPGSPGSQSCGETTVFKVSSVSSYSLTLPVLWSNQTRAWFLDSTLQSKVALFWAGRHRATDLPILTGSSRYTCRSWNGCELGRQVNTASAEGIDFGLRVLLQPDTRDTFSWSRVAGLCCNPQRIIYNIRGLCVGRAVSPLSFSALTNRHCPLCTDRAVLPSHGSKLNSCVFGKSENKKQTNRYKRDKTFPSLTVHQSYITTLKSGSRHYVQTRVPCVKTYMTEYSTDSLANSLPRPSNSSSTGAGDGSRWGRHGLDLQAPPETAAAAASHQ